MKTPVEWTQNTRDPVGRDPVGHETHRIRWDNETHKSGGTGNTQVEWTGNTRDPVGQETHRIRWDMKHTGSGGTGNTQDPVGQETHCGGVRPR